MITTAALPSGPMYTTVTPDGIVHVRSTFAKAEVCPAPDWIAQIGSAGGAHNIATCPRCWVQTILKQQREATGVAETWRLEDAQFLQSQQAERPESYQVPDQELEFLLAKQSVRYRRVADHSPVRRLPAVLRELRLMATVISRQLQTGKLSKTQSDMTLLRYFDVQAAASIVWERLKDVGQDALSARRLRSLIPPSSPYS